MISTNGFATFRKKGWPDLGPIPVKVRPGGSRGSIKGGNFIEFEYSIAWDTDYEFTRTVNGVVQRSQIDGTTTMIHPGYADGTPIVLNIPRRSVRWRIASCNFNVESPS